MGNAQSTTRGCAASEYARQAGDRRVRVVESLLVFLGKEDGRMSTMYALHGLGFRKELHLKSLNLFRVELKGDVLVLATDSIRDVEQYVRTAAAELPCSVYYLTDSNNDAIAIHAENLIQWSQPSQALLERKPDVKRPGVYRNG